MVDHGRKEVMDQMNAEVTEMVLAALREGQLPSDTKEVTFRITNPEYEKVTEELLPCWCSIKHNLPMLLSRVPEGPFWIECDLCGLRTGEWPTEEGAMKAWNNREHRFMPAQAEGAVELLEKFALWHESVHGGDISNYDQDTTPYQVWLFLTRAKKECDHEWVSADNEVVSGCMICVKCLDVTAASDVQEVGGSQKVLCKQGDHFVEELFKNGMCKSCWDKCRYPDGQVRLPSDDFDDSAS